MNQKSYNAVTAAVSVLSLLISLGALYLAWSQYQGDYEKTVLVQPGTVRLTKFSEGESSFELEIVNSSKNNLRYFLLATSNMGCISGVNGRPTVLPCGYESQIITLSKADVGRNAYKHVLHLNAGPGLPSNSPLAYISPAEYFLNLEVIDAANGRMLYRSACFYAFHVEARVFALDQPDTDSSGQSADRQRLCLA